MSMKFKALMLLTGLSCWYELSAQHVVRINSIGSLGFEKDSLGSENLELEELPDARAEVPSPFLVVAEPRTACCCKLFDGLFSIQEKANNFMLYGVIAKDKDLDNVDFIMAARPINQNYHQYLQRPETLSHADRYHWATERQKAIQKVRKSEVKVALCCGSILTGFMTALVVTTKQQKID